MEDDDDDVAMTCLVFQWQQASSESGRNANKAVLSKPTASNNINNNYSNNYDIIKK